MLLPWLSHRHRNSNFYPLKWYRLSWGKRNEEKVVVLMTRRGGVPLGGSSPTFYIEVLKHLHVTFSVRYHLPEFYWRWCRHPSGARFIYFRNAVIPFPCRMPHPLPFTAFLLEATSSFTYLSLTTAASSSHHQHHLGLWLLCPVFVHATLKTFPFLWLKY